MKAAAALLAFPLAACAIVPPVNAEPIAAIGEVAYVNGLKVRPLKLLEDSRCPLLVRCVWAGRIVVRSEVTGGSWRQIRDVELGKPQPIADGNLTLVEARPAKATPEPIDPGAYRFTFAFQGGL